MAVKKSLAQKIIKPLASIKLAVFVILAMACVTAWGTFVESIYNDAKRAQETVYHSWISYSVFFLLAVNLIAVMVNRWPWKKKHIGFLSAHIGIIILMLGSLMTRYLGIDGSMALKTGSTKDQVIVRQTDLIVYSGLISGQTRKIYEQEVHFLKKPPSPARPHRIHLGSDQIVIDNFRPYSIPQEKITSGEKGDFKPAVRFQISNPRVSHSGWILLGASDFEEQNMGPAKIVLSKKGAYFEAHPHLSGKERQKKNGGIKDPKDYPRPYGKKHILLLESSENSDQLEYSLFSPGKTKGFIRAGESIKTGWMGLEFRLLKFLKSAQKTWTYRPVKRATEKSVESIRFRFRGKEYWMGLNSSVRLFSESAYHILIYANRQLKLDFALRLDDFKIGRWQGSQRASSYESNVSVISKDSPPKKTNISMNNPLKHKGFSFYQSSFEEDEKGQPVLSILSVNRDPGRFLKYLGSVLLVFGIIHLFYRKQIVSGKAPQ